MKALIAYGTRLGTTRRCAQLIGGVLREKGCEVDFAELPAGGRGPSTSGYDLVVVGANARMGKLHPGARKYMERRQSEIGPGKLALYACCGAKTEEDVRQLFWASYPPGLMARARSAVSLGGALEVDRLPWLLKTLLKRSGTADFDTVDETRVTAWAKSLARP